MTEDFERGRQYINGTGVGTCGWAPGARCVMAGRKRGPVEWNAIRRRARRSLTTRVVIKSIVRQVDLCCTCTGARCGVGHRQAVAGSRCRFFRRLLKKRHSTVKPERVFIFYYFCLSSFVNGVANVFSSSLYSAAVLKLLLHRPFVRASMGHAVVVVSFHSIWLEVYLKLPGNYKPIIPTLAQ